MADITYIVNQQDPNTIPGVEQISQADTQLVSQFGINSLFDRNKNYIELHILNLVDDLLQSDYNYSGYLELGNAQSAGKEGASILTIDPVQDVKTYQYETGGVKLLYHFLNDLFSKDKTNIEFFIQDISSDRTELKLKTFNLSDEEVVRITADIKSKLENQSYFNEFRLNFKNNDLFVGLNIDTLTDSTGVSVVVKLYEALPASYDLKSTLSITELISDSAAFEVDYNIEQPQNILQTLRPANFNLDIIDNDIIPTQYLNYDELFSYPVNNTNSQIYSLYSEKGVELSIDHSDYSNFIHFSSAYERLANFKYKLQLIESYSSSLAQINNTTSQSLGTTGSVSYYNALTQGILSNFDHYERYLYYQSSSYAWPKSSTTVPYVNKSTSDNTALSWYVDQLSLANSYDLQNLNAVVNSIPSFLRDDPNNQNYITFVHMIGQHFDNLWIYTKGVSDKYNADNRLDFGISKDLVGEVLKNFGVKLYTSNKSIEDLFSSFIGQAYQSGSEVITNYVTGSITGSNTPIQPSSVDNYQREIYKRIYHNLPLLLKSKGTERGLRALINCFGIPSDILDIKIYGGRNINERPFYGDYRYFTSSLDKIRLDNTGSIITGSTLSQYTSIVKREYKYTDDLHPIEIGFSPADNVDNYIISKSLSTGSLSSFNIDDYLGDPRNLYLDNYYTLSAGGSISGSLDQLTDRIMTGSSAYNVYDFVRLIKFFDNTIFKVVKDFIPARSTADTGIIIKPHLLQRNKAKSVIVSGSRPEYTGSIDTAFTQGSSGGSYSTITSYYNTSYTDITQTPVGLSGPFTEQGVNIDIVPVTSHAHEEARFNGELNNSEIQVSDGELNRDNIYKSIENVAYPYNINFVSGSNEVCLLSLAPGVSSPVYITSSTATLTHTDFFIYTNTTSIYTASIPVVGGLTNTITFPTTIQNLQTTFTGLQQYSTGSITVNNVNYTLGPCTSTINFIYATCSLLLTPEGQNINNVIVSPYPNLSNITTYNLTDWFTCHQDQGSGSIGNLKFEITVGATTTTISNIPGSNSIYSFQFDPSLNGQSATITVSDEKAGPGCRISKTVNVGNCVLGGIVTGSEGLEFTYSTAPIHGVFINADIGESSENAYVYNGTPLGFPSVISYGTGGTFRYIEQPIQVTAGTGGIQRRGIQSYFTPYPPDPGTRYSVFFVRKQGSNWTAETIISNVRSIDVSNYNIDNDIVIPPQDSGNIPNVPGAYPPIKIITPYQNRIIYNVDAQGNILGTSPVTLGPDEVVRLIVVQATLPDGGCTRQVTIYPSGLNYGTPVFTPVTIPINWNPILGTPLSGVNYLYNVPVRTYQ